MKHALALTCSFVVALAGCRRDSEPPRPGGQSGDDGDLSPGDLVAPGPPPEPCDWEEVPLALDAATPFGASASELVSSVAPTRESPLFWVPYDSTPGVTFTPGPGETSIALGIEPRAGEMAKLSSFHPLLEGAVCEHEKIRVPVHVTLRSADGALDASAEAELLFTSATTAELQTGFALDAVGGSFALSLGDAARGSVAGGLALEAQLWLGGNRGVLYPSLEVPGPPGDPDAPSADPSGALQGTVGPPPPPRPEPPAADVIAAPTLPEHWSAVAVWPRLEQCAYDGRRSAYAYAAGDRVIGSSMTEIVELANARGPFLVSLGDRTASLRFDVEAPTGLRCAAPDTFGTNMASRTLTFDVRATLSADDAEGSALAELETTSIFELTATTAADGTLTELRWARRDRAVGESPDAFEAATGLALDVPSDSERLMWSWHSSNTREGASAPWSPHGALVVTSLSSEQTAEIARIRKYGDPDSIVRLDEETKLPHLPGDPLLDAEIVP